MMHNNIMKSDGVAASSAVLEVIANNVICVSLFLLFFFLGFFSMVSYVVMNTGSLLMIHMYGPWVWVTLTYPTSHFEPKYVQQEQGYQKPEPPSSCEPCWWFNLHGTDI